MNLDQPILNMKPLKNYFIYSFIAVITIFLGSLAISAFLYSGAPSNSKGSLIFLGALMLVSFWRSQKSKKDLQVIRETQDWPTKLALYEKRYKGRLAFHVLSVAVTAAFWVLGNKNAFLYLMIAEVGLTLVYYPVKKIIATELNEPDIESI